MVFQFMEHLYLDMMRQPDDIEKTLEFAIEEKLALAAFNHLVPYPGTPLYHRFEKSRLIDKECG